MLFRGFVFTVIYMFSILVVFGTSLTVVWELSRTVFGVLFGSLILMIFPKVRICMNISTKQCSTIICFCFLMYFEHLAENLVKYM